MKTNETTDHGPLTTTTTEPELQIPGWYDWHEWAKQTIAALSDGAVYVEVGCFLGKSTCDIARLIQQSGKKIVLHAVDKFETEDPALGAPGKFAKKFELNLKAAGVRKLVRMWKKPSLEAAQQFAETSLDVVFLDADHSYEAVSADIQAWWPKLKPGGLLAGHDIHTYDSVWRAVQDEARRLGVKVTVVAEQNIWVVRKP